MAASDTQKLNKSQLGSYAVFLHSLLLCFESGGERNKGVVVSALSSPFRSSSRAFESSLCKRQRTSFSGWVDDRKGLADVAVEELGLWLAKQVSLVEAADVGSLWSRDEVVFSARSSW